MRIQKPADLARLVKTRRQAWGLTQQDIADAVGITRQSLARIESGHGGTSFETVLRIFEHLDIRLEAVRSGQHQVNNSTRDNDEVQRITSDTLTSTRNIDTSALAAAALRNVDTSAFAAAALRNVDTSAFAAAALRNVDTSAFAAAALRNVDTSAFAAAALRNVDTSALASVALRDSDIPAIAAAAAAAIRGIDTSALLSSWRDTLNNLTVQVQETGARTGSEINAKEARKALLSAAIEAGDPDREDSIVEEEPELRESSDGAGSG